MPVPRTLEDLADEYTGGGAKGEYAYYGYDNLVEFGEKVRAADAEVTKERDEARDWALGMDQGWPVPDCLLRLAEAADILLHKYNYDGDGHEEIATARDSARAHVARLDAAGIRPNSKGE